MKFGPAVRFRDPIVSGSESVAGRLWTTDKSRADDDDDDGARVVEKKNSYYDATTTTASRKKILHLYIFYCVKKKKTKTSIGMSSGVHRNAAENWWRELMVIIII